MLIGDVMIVERTKVIGKSNFSRDLSLLERAGCSVGDAQWWEAIVTKGVPLMIDEQDEYAEVVFIWREPKEQKLPRYKEVYIDISGVTDHHSFDMAKLSKVGGTDVWFYVEKIKRTLRGGYSFIPVTLGHSQPCYSGSYEEQKVQHRQWLRSIFPLSCRDELNQQNVPRCAWGKSTSPLCMPDALPQPEWQGFDQLLGQSIACPDLTLTWCSELLSSTRDIWLCCTAPEQNRHRVLPVVFVLDGRFWSQSLPIYDALFDATNNQRLPEAIYVLIDEVNGQQRNEELCCNSTFWQAVSQELIPLVSNHFSITKDPSKTAIVGQSLGGLSATYAALNWPERFGCVVSQSGSFWWPDISLIKPPCEYIAPKTPELLSEMSQNIHRGLGANRQLNIFIEVGSGEDIMVNLSRDVYQQLAAQQHRINYRVFEGGHDRLCWRGGLIDGLSYVFQCESN